MKFLKLKYYGEHNFYDGETYIKTEYIPVADDMLRVEAEVVEVQHPREAIQESMWDSTMTDALMIALDHYLADDKKIRAIKLLRAATAMGLKESKDSIDMYQLGHFRLEETEPAIEL